MEMLRLEDLRKDKDLEQKDIALLLSCTQQHVSRMELGSIPLYVERLILLSKFYNTSVDYILGLTNERKPYPRSK